MAAAVNSQVTDAVTQTNVKVVGEAPAMAMGNIYQMLAHSAGILSERAARAQQRNASMQSVTAQGVEQILSADTAAGGAEGIGQADLPVDFTPPVTAGR